MDEFSLQRRLFKQLIKTKPSLSAGMALTLKEITKTKAGASFKKLPTINWDAGLTRWVAWMDRLLKKHPIPKNTELLWFEVPSELNEAFTSISAFAKLGPKSDSYGFNQPRHWPINKDGWTLPAGLETLPDLERAIRASGFRKAKPDAREALLPPIYAISYAYVTLAVLNGLPRTKLLSSPISSAGAAVFVGWAEGDYDPIGLLTKSGWKKIPSVKGASAPMPEELDPDSFMFDVRKYIAAGRDLERKDPRTGSTLLLRLAGFYDFTQMRHLVEAGANVRAKDRAGRGILHYAGDLPIKTLQFLISHGADPRLVAHDGATVIDHNQHSGTWTLAHDKFYFSLGARPGKNSKGETPLHALGAGPLFERGTAADVHRRIKFWLSKRLDIDAPRKDGATPLWLALHAHADERLEQLKTAQKLDTSAGRDDYGHDRVAIMLLEHGADPNLPYRGPKHKLIPAGSTPLMLQRYDDDSLVRALLKHGADPLALCSKGKTALDYAAQAAKDPKRIDRKGAKAVVKLLERAMTRTPR